MSDNNLHRIFANTACVSTEMMMNYLDGKLSEKEKNTVEVHIASCEMCRDEFEGLSFLEDKTQLASIVTDLDEKIDTRLKTGGKKISLFKRPLYRIAAAIVILITSAWFLKLYVDSSLTNMDESMVSQAMEEKVESVEESAPESIDEERTIETSKDQTVPGQQNQERDKLDRIQEIKGPESKKEESTERILTIEDAEADLEFDEEIAVEELSASKENEVVIAEKAIVEDKLKDEKKVVNKEIVKADLADDIKEKKLNDEVVADYSIAEGEKTDRKATRGNNKKNKLFKGRSKKKAEIVTNTVMLDNFDLAMTQYNNRDYKQAVELFKKSLDAHSNTDEVHFYLAKSYTQLDDTEKALVNYNKVIAFAQSPYYEDALLNKAQILVELDKRKSAINSLNQLKNRKGVYSKRAAKIIDSLNIVNPATELEKDK